MNLITFNLTFDMNYKRVLIWIYQFKIAKNNKNSNQTSI